jgi:CHASE2 domain-containing sensor protein
MVLPPPTHARASRAARRSLGFLHHLGRRRWWALCIVAGCAIAEYFVGHSSWGHKAQASGYLALHRLIRAVWHPVDLAERSNVVVVDISDIKPNEKGYTPPRMLRTLLQNVVEAKAQALGIDIDLSHDARFPSRDEFDTLMDEGLDAQNKRGVRIAFGVYRTTKHPPDAWLEHGDWAGLAAWIGFPEERDLGIFVPTQVENPHRNLPSMAASLAGGVPKPPLPLLAETSRVVFGEDKVGVHLALSDLGMIAAARAAVVRVNATGEIPPVDLARLAGKIVVAGDVSDPSPEDRFKVPGIEHDLLPGVFLHAAGAATLTHNPLFQLSHTLGYWGGIFAMLVIAVRGGWHSFAHAAVTPVEEIRHSLLAFGRYGAGVVLLALALTAAFRVVWLEVFMVLFFVLLHALLECAMLARVSKPAQTSPQTSPAHP